MLTVQGPYILYFAINARIFLLFSPRSVIKKRKHFEYKLQKRTKEKEDILSYIQYESSLLHLIGMRRDVS